MLALINATVVFAFGLVITGIVLLGVMQARDQELRPRVATDPASRDRHVARKAA